MPIRIWEPRRYADGFNYKDTDYMGSCPYNGEPAAAPKNRDRVIREVTRFEGSKTTCYRDTGEFEVTIPAGQVVPADIKAGYLVEFDGDMFIIETYKWEATDAGYTCTISGRDFGLYIDTRYYVDQGLEFPVAVNLGGATTDGTVSTKGIRFLLETFFFWNNQYGGSDAFAYYFDGVYWAASTDMHPNSAGWWKDPDRQLNPSGAEFSRVVREAFEDTTNTGKSLGTNTISEATTWGGVLRTFCAYFDIGYRWDYAFDQDKGLYKITPTLYNRADSGLMLRTNGRGVSGFSYEHDTRDMITGVAACCKYKDPSGENADADTEYNVWAANVFNANDETNFCNVSENYREKFVDYGSVPQETIESATYPYRTVLSWLGQQLEGESEAPKQTITFKYDNSGALKYGRDFFLGSRLSIVDDFLNLAQSATLTEVTASYKAGAAVSYDFTFGDKALTQADKLKKKFKEVGRVTFGNRKTSAG